MNIEEFKQIAWEYVELETKTKVTKVEFIENFRLLSQDNSILKVTTVDKDFPEWYVVGGDTPFNLYDVRKFSSPDEAFSFHTGIMIRMLERNYVEPDESPKEIGYDAFISHATEDKDDLVRPLAGLLKKYGFRIWYDEFEIEIGDSLRESIIRLIKNPNLINTARQKLPIPISFSEIARQYQLEYENLLS